MKAIHHSVYEAKSAEIQQLVYLSKEREQSIRRQLYDLAKIRRNDERSSAKMAEKLLLDSLDKAEDVHRQLQQRSQY